MIEETPAIKTDFFISLPSEADLPNALSAFYKQDYVTVVDEETGEETQTPDGDPYLVAFTTDYAVDLVGTIYKPTGNTLTDDEGNDYPELAAVPGYHVNVRLLNDTYRSMIEAIDVQFGVEPATPERVWA